MGKLEELKSKAKNLGIDILECRDDIFCIENKIKEKEISMATENLRKMINPDKNIDLEQ